MSLFLFILPDRDDSLIGEYIDEVVRDGVRSYGFQYCEKEKTSFFDGNNVLQSFYTDRCSPLLAKTMKIDNFNLDADTMGKTGKYDWRVNEMFKALNKYNDKHKKTKKYKLMEFDTYNKRKNYTEIIMWLLFILSIPIIWFSRNFSIIILNSFMSAIKKGWKKI